MKYIIGIDEVGRGPLAGPVTVGVVVCEAKLYTALKRRKDLPPLGKDSKKLSEDDRKKYAQVLKGLAKQSAKGSPKSSANGLVGHIDFAVIHISNTHIDTRGISVCIKSAIERGIKQIGFIEAQTKNKNKNKKDTQRFDVRNTHVLLDGGLKAPPMFAHQKTIIKGDEKEQIIAWASILAKVSRDALMTRMGKKFPQYGFAQHKGYGTLAHRRSLAEHGLSAMHRKTFCRKYR